MVALCSVLLALSIWDYPARQPQHEALRMRFVVAQRKGDTATMESVCRSGVELLPDDPTWRYNLACSLVYFPKRREEAMNTLEEAIDLGFRDEKKIASDPDFKQVAGTMRFQQLVEYAKEMKTRPLLFGPNATVDATGIFGSAVSLGEQNLGWDFDCGCFTAYVKLAPAKAEPWTGDLYMNRDGGHSKLNVGAFPGLTEVRLDAEGREKRMDLDLPNIILPLPTFGNCSRALVGSPYWRSIPRALVTMSASKIKTMERAYLSNQIWVFPSNADTPPVGTNGDVFASITPYCMTTAGRSFSDLPCLRAALHASAAFDRKVKAEIVRRGLLAPTIMTLMRKSLGFVNSEDEYTGPRAHPTAMPPDGVNTNRLKAAAAAMTIEAIPPLVTVAVRTAPPVAKSAYPELTYATPFAWAFVLRSDDETRVFQLIAEGAEEYRFVQTHGTGVQVKIESTGVNSAKVTINRKGMGPVNRVDIAVFGKRRGTGWGAPSYISFARMDPKAPYSDPVLTPGVAPAAAPAAAPAPAPKKGAAAK